jgi:hypothetical protein
MPRQTRWAIKQKLDTVLKELERIENKLVEVGILYKELHPEIYEKYALVLAGVSAFKDSIKSLRDEV